MMKTMQKAISATSRAMAVKSLKSMRSPSGLVVERGVAVITEREAAFGLVAGSDVMRHGGPCTAALAVAERAGEDELAEAGLSGIVAVGRP